MRIKISILYHEVFTLEWSFPKLGIFTPGDVPESVEAIQWGDPDE